MRTVTRFKVEFEPEFQEEFAQGCKRILSSDRLTNGPCVEKFEREFAKFVGAKFAVAVGSGTDALEAALLAVGVAGKPVIIPTNTFIATAVAVLRAGGQPVILDIEGNSFSLDPELLSQTICENTGAVILVHVGGIISQYVERIKELCWENQVPLIEDAAHAHGSCTLNRGAGAFGDIGCFSFYPTKVMTTGEGGMLTTNLPEYARAAHRLCQFGRDRESSLESAVISGNLKMTEFQGLLGCLELNRVMERIDRRNALAMMYSLRLHGSAYECVLPHQYVNSWYKLIVRIPERLSETIRPFCLERGVDLAGEVYRVPLHRQPALRITCQCPVADHFSKTHICPPLYPEMTEDDVNYVCDVLLEALR